MMKPDTTDKPTSDVMFPFPQSKTETITESDLLGHRLEITLSDSFISERNLPTTRGCSKDRPVDFDGPVHFGTRRQDSPLFEKQPRGKTCPPLPETGQYRRSRHGNPIRRIKIY